jgi:DNA invertase Pin-like site-specific DNA recombinase
MPTHVIAYRRVSTSEQGQSGLGLEAQKADIDIFAKANDLKIIADYFDVASGKGRLEHRVELSKAITHCKREKCALIVSKVDRLSRNHACVATLMEQGFEFIVVQLGLKTDSFSTHLFSALAERERLFISQRTKEALARKKARNEPLGNLISLPLARENGYKTLKANADEFAEKFREQITLYQSKDMSLRQIAQALNKFNVRTYRGHEWKAQSVANLIKRLEI